MWIKFPDFGETYNSERDKQISARPGRLTGGSCSRVLLCVIMAALIGQSETSSFAQSQETQAVKLLQTGLVLAEKTQYLEALDLLQEARDALDASGGQQTALYADFLYSLAQTKIRGRLHQDFPSYYVKAARDDVQAANKLRELIPGIVSQKLAEGYFLEGFIHKRFFLQKSKAYACFQRAIKIDPGSAAAKRELSELIPTKESKGD